MPDLLYGEAENDLREAVRSLLRERCRAADVIARTESTQPYDPALWQAMTGQLGAAGLLVPEALGGAGASYREAAVVAEETGRAVAPVPYLGSAVVATAVLLAATRPPGSDPADSELAGSDPAGSELAGSESDRKLLAALADGTTTAALVLPFESAPGTEPPATIRVVGPHTGDQAETVRLTGTATRVADALPADVLIVPADAVPYGLYAVDARDAGVRRTPLVSLDATRPLCDLTLEAVPARQIAAGAAARHAIDAALTAGTAMLAAEQLGLADQCVAMTVAYVKERRQFARPVGSFQAIKHRLADLWVSVTQARAAARYAAACLAAGDEDTAVAVAMAKAYCSEVAVKAAEECVQLHGGIGFTWEHPAHLYLKRAKSSSVAFGTPDRHRAALARLAGLPGESRGPGSGER
ncbi:MAG TPA: acyl-CoA dehydrogenase family protein [Streptosporangiaceae bacterium]|nr:acyl-CoA dehydrogenase family protein [Streptosporangiaceae bacterium]